MRQSTINILLIFLISLGVFAQSDSLTIVESKNLPSSLTSLFDKRLNTYSLNSKFVFSKQFGNFSTFLSEEFRSTVVKSATNSIKDENYLNLSTAYELFPNFETGMLLSSNTYSDDRRLAINKTSVMEGQLFINYEPIEKITLTPFAGYSENQQVGNTDIGPVYGGELFIDRVSLADLTVKGTARFENEDISPRKNAFRMVRLDIDSDFESSLMNNLQFNFVEQRRDFYFEMDSSTSAVFGVTNNIQSRTEDQYQLQNRLSYFSPSSNISLDIGGNIFWRSIDRNTKYILVDNVTQSSFDTKIEEFKIDLNSSMIYRLDNLRGRLRISYSERDERHSPKPIEGANEIFLRERRAIEDQKNNSAKLITLTAQNIYDISSDDKISLSVFHRKLIYDTPSGENFDDRDELLTTAKLSYLRNVNYFFDLFINIEGSINKIVYIFAERSSNNNIKRFIKLESGGIFKSRNVISSNSAEVSANYTVYDYEELNPNFRSFSFRQFAFRDSTIIKWNNKIFTEITGYVKLSEQGDFKWAEFVNQPVRFLEEIYLEPKTFYRIEDLHLGLGIRFFQLSTFGYNDVSEKELISQYSSIGPLVDIKLRMNDRLRLKVYGYYEFISNESNTKQERANLNMQVDWYL
ncbi:MAG: hypothetical protein U5K00_13220 [Melioribacteraceae bacterium]|nr:hypothetical protein [Melioribacteraceae bacterium]